MGAIRPEALAQCRTLDELHDRCAPLGLYNSGRRFLHLELDVVNRCNLRCVMCYHSLDITRQAKTFYLQPADFEAYAAPVLPHAHQLSLSLGNEPLMSPHFSSILRIASRFNVPHVNFFTNGLLLTDEIIDTIIACGVTQVCVSVDGATPATYNAIRRDGDFDQLVDRVERLIARRNAAGRSTPRVRFDVVMMKRNIHELVAIVELAGRLGVQDLSLRHLVAFEGLDMEGDSLTTVKALSNYWLARALAAAARLGLDVQTQPAPFTHGAEGAVPAPQETPFIPTPYCPYPFFHITMAPGGHVLACPYSHGEAPFGRVSPETPLDQVWLGPKFTELRQRILRHDPPDMCRRCPHLAIQYPDVEHLFATRRHHDLPC